jgi:hypothetical protein
MDVGITANVIILSEDHPSLFAVDPYCFTTNGMPLESKVKLSFLDFQKGLDGVVGDSAQMKILSAFRFRRVSDVMKIRIKSFQWTISLLSSTLFDLTNYKGQPSGPYFTCNKSVKPPVSAVTTPAAPVSAAAALQVPNLMAKAARVKRCSKTSQSSRTSRDKQIIRCGGSQ